MRAVSTLTALGATLSIAAGSAGAVGFGRGVNSTQLGQPLDFRVPVRIDTDETLDRDCVSATVQVGDRPLAPGLVRVQLESVDRTAATERAVRVRVRTAVAIDEPVVEVSVSVGCSAASATRRFVAFVDPPSLQLARAASIEADARPMITDPSPGAGSATEAPATVGVGRLATDPPAPRSTRRPARRAKAPVLVAHGPVTLARPGASAASSVASRAPALKRNPFGQAAVRTAVGPRLRLEPGPDKPVPVPVTPVAAAASASASPSSTLGARMVPASMIVSTATQVAAAASASDIASAPTAALDAAMPVPPAPARAGVDVAASASSPARGGSAPKAEPERLRGLESGLAQLRSDTRANEAAVSQLQARLERAESERYGNPLVYALGLVSALLGIGLAVLWRRQARTRRDGGWWVGQDTGPVPSMYRERDAAPPEPGAPPTADSADGAETTEPGVLPAGSPPRSRPTPTPPSAADEATRPAPFVASASASYRHTDLASLGPLDLEPPASTLGPLSSSPRPSPTAIPGSTASTASAAARELTVEELIDLEQQVEFFVVLGQDDAAIDLLRSHVRSEGGMSPLPYLKLLEIHRRIGDEAEYRAIRERFNRRFNAYVPDWPADLAQGRVLADYPDTVRRLQAIWRTPTRAMETLDATLFGRGPSEESFDLPAYRELLLLYSVARDLAEHAARPTPDRIDIDLPLDAPQEAPIARLSASTRPDDAPPLEMPTLPLDLDVSIGELPPPASPRTSPARPPLPPLPYDTETVPAALRRTDSDRIFRTESNFVDLDLNFDLKPGRSDDDDDRDGDAGARRGNVSRR